MGLLDFASDPEGMQGLSLLAAAGPSMEPMNFASRLALAGNTYRGLIGDQLKQQQLAQQVQSGALQLRQAQEQWQLLQPIYKAMADAYSNDPSSGAPAASSQPDISPSPGGALGSGTFGIPVGGQSASAPASAPAAGGRSRSIFGLPLNVAGPVLAMGGPGKLADAVTAANAPTDIIRNIRAAGIDPGSPLGQQMIQAQIAKQNYIPPVALRTPAWLTSDGQTHVLPSDQISAAYGGKSEAESRGKGNIATKQIWDPNADAGNGKKGAYVFKTESQIADASTGGPVAPASVPAPLRNNNPGAVMPGGKLAQYPTPEAGLAAMDATLANYGKAGVSTVQDVIKRWAPPNENDTASYVKDVSQRLGVFPNQKIDLSNPVQRQAIATAIMLHENGPGNVFSAPKQAGGPLLSQPPLGATNAAETSQGAPSKNMAEAYNGLSTADANYQQSREALTGMLQLANSKGVVGAVGGGALPESISTRIMPEAAKYQKLHATYVALQGKALGSGGTDAARATIDEAIPTYDKPQSAMVSGINTQLNNLDVNHLKTQFLSPVYQRGDEKTFTRLSAAFDQNITPSMAPILMMSGPQQKAAVQAAIASNPSLRPRFEWAFNNGLLK